MRPRIVFALACGALAACSSGGGEDDSPAAAAALAPPPGDASAPAAEVDTDTLVANATARVRGHLDVGLESVAAALDGEALRAGLATVAGRGAGAAVFEAFAAGAGDVADGGGATSGPFADDPAPSPARRLFADAPSVDLEAGAGDARDAADRFLAGTLGGEGARVSRDGDRVTVDPDEAALCAEGGLAPRGTAADCAALLGRVLVVLDAARAESGVARWQFDGEDVLRVAYGPDAASYELDLAGLGAFGRASAALAGEPDPVPATLEGALRLAATVRSSAPGAEAARLALFVSEPVRVEDPHSGTRFAFDVSTLWSVDADAAAGTLAGRVSIGPVSLVGRLDGGAGPEFAFELPGWTVDARADAAAGALELALVGIGEGEASLSLDGVRLLGARLPYTSLAVEGGATRFRAPLDASLELAVPEVGEASWRVAAPAGTRLVDRGRGVVEVEAGGPWRVEEGYTVDGRAHGTVRVAGAGECFDTDWEDPDRDGTFSRFAPVGCP